MSSYQSWALLFALVLGPTLLHYILEVGVIPLASGAAFWVISISIAVPVALFATVRSLDSLDTGLVAISRPPNSLALRERVSHRERVRSQPSVKVSAPLDKAQKRLIPLITKDFVTRWYSAIARGQSNVKDGFEHEVQRTLEHVVVSLRDRMVPLDPTKLYRSVLSEATAHLEAIRWQDTRSEGYIDANDYESDLFLASRYNQTRRLHPAISSPSSDTRPTELPHVRRLAGRIIQSLLPAEEGRTAIIYIALQEVIACTILLPIIDRISEPDFWSEIVDRKASMLLEEERLIRNLRAAVVLEHTKAASSASSKSTKGRQTAPDAFERYLAQIRRMKSPVEARKLRQNLKLRLQSATIPHQKADMLRRALATLDARILDLGNADISAKTSNANPAPGDITFAQVLNDPIATSYFSECLELRGREQLMQYHISIDSWKMPLELPGIATASSLSGDDAAHFASILEHPILSFLPPRYRDTLQSFQHDNSTVTELEARRAISESHQAVLDELLEEDWLPFQESKQYGLAKAIINEQQQQRATKRDGSPTPFETFMPQPRSPSFARSSRIASTINQDTPRAASLEGMEVKRGNRQDLFGDDSNHGGLESKPESGQPEGTISRDRSDERHMQQLLGGKSGMLSNLDGRSPLFSDPLFDEDSPDVQAVPLSSEGTRSSERDEKYVRSETIDALQQTISDLVHPAPLSRPGQVRTYSESPRSEDPRLVQGLRAAQASGQELPSALQVPRLPSTPRRSSAPIFRASGAQDGRASSEDDRRSVSSSAHTVKAITVDLEGEAAERLRKKRQMLTAQLEVLSKLSVQYELMGEAPKEQQLVEKSITSVRRELDVIESHLSEVGRYDLEAARMSITIPSTTVNTDADGKHFNVFHVRICLHPKDGEGQDASWTCYRRYSEFDTLHSGLLAANLPQNSVLEALFPGKRLVALNSTPAFIESRRRALEKYLQRVAESAEACSTSILRRFLRSGPFAASTSSAGGGGGNATAGLSGSKLFFPGHAIFRDIFRNVDDLLFGTTPLVDVLSSHLSNSGLGGASAVPSAKSATAEAAISHAIPGLSVTQAQAKEAASAGHSGTGAITGPLIDLLIELLDLRQDEWRRTAIVVVVQQVLGGTIDRQVRTRLRQLTSEECLASLLEMLRNNLWPEGQLRDLGAKVTRGPAAREALRQRAKSKIDLLLPQMASLVGREKAKRGARRLFNAVTQSRRLNRHLVYTLLDILVEEVFPPPPAEADVRSGE